MTTPSTPPKLTPRTADDPEHARRLFTIGRSKINGPDVLGPSKPDRSSPARTSPIGGE